MELNFDKVYENNYDKLYKLTYRLAGIRNRLKIYCRKHF